MYNTLYYSTIKYKKHRVYLCLQFIPIYILYIVHLGIKWLTWPLHYVHIVREGSPFLLLYTRIIFKFLLQVCLCLHHLATDDALFQYSKGGEQVRLNVDGPDVGVMRMYLSVVFVLCLTYCVCIE